jgi:alkane 1-monooxygenase
MLSLLVPAAVAAGPLLSLWLDSAWALWAPVVFVYGVAPFIDLALGADTSNPPESAVAQLEADVYYRRVTHTLVPLLWLAFVGAAWFAATHALPWYGWLALVISTGNVGGFCINLGHELGHKRGALDRTLAKLVLAPTGYGHFSIEHNRGHHRDVATPADPASSRMGESIYRFLLREMPGAWKRAWALEAARLKAEKLPLISWHNEILQPLAVTVLLWAALVGWLGGMVLPFLLATAFWANFQLTSANYVEHYGLLRAERAPGKFEPCQPQHSWNSNHVFSNWATFHLQRHADHHAHPLRSYQSLRHFEGLPQLPNGYFGMFVVAYIPWWWFSVMDPRLLAAVGRDPAKINFDPERQEALIARHKLR